MKNTCSIPLENQYDRHGNRTRCVQTTYNEDGLPTLIIYRNIHNDRFGFRVVKVGYSIYKRYNRRKKIKKLLCQK